MMPSISCVIPAANRRLFLPEALSRFLAQRCDDAELIILDNGADAIADLVPADPRIRYEHVDTRLPLGAMRNRLCAMARGDIIIHWDDDWHAPNRLARQVAALEASGAEVCGVDRVIFMAADGSAAWDYSYRGSGPWVAGGSLCYRRDYWRAHPFPELRAGEDTKWILAQPRERVHIMADNTFFVARVHAGNTSPKRTNGAWWTARDPVSVRALMTETTSRIDTSSVRARAPVKPLANIYACLVHEKPECVVDLVRNLRAADSASTILLYDGSARGDLLDPRLRLAPGTWIV
jgi:hypothetical protein